MAVPDFGGTFVPKFDVKLSPNFGYVYSKDRVEDMKTEYEVSTVSSFVVKTFRWAKKCQDPGKQRVCWRDISYSNLQVPNAVINFDGIPYTLVGTKVYECHHGKDWKEQWKQRKRDRCKEAFENYGFRSKPRKSLGTKKVDCPARLLVKEIIKYPDFKIPFDTESRQYRASTELRKALGNGEEVSSERRFYIYFPTKDDHKGTHPMGEVDRTSQRGVNKKLKDIIVGNYDISPSNDDNADQYDNNAKLQQQCVDILTDIKELTYAVNETQPLHDLKRSLTSCLEEARKKLPHEVPSKQSPQKRKKRTRNVSNTGIEDSIDKSKQHHPYGPRINLMRTNNETIASNKDMCYTSTSKVLPVPAPPVQNCYQIEQVGAIMTLVNLQLPYS